jgi:hypothetical protein
MMSWTSSTGSSGGKRRVVTDVTRDGIAGAGERYPVRVEPGVLRVGDDQVPDGLVEAQQPVDGPGLSAGRSAPCLDRRPNRGLVAGSRIDVVDCVATPEASLARAPSSG